MRISRLLYRNCKEAAENLSEIKAMDEDRTKVLQGLLRGITERLGLLILQFEPMLPVNVRLLRN